MSVRHVAVWIDHKEAKLFHIEPEGFEASKIKAPHHHLTRKAEEQGHHAGSERFFQEVAVALAGADEILIVGPSSAKLDFIRHVHKHEHALEPKIVGVETLDHPTDGQLVAYVRHYFHGTDRMRGLVP
jgi:stalled ribosome rescue protein Dom34